MRLQDATDIKLGTTSASKVMLGTTVVWSKSSPQHDYSQDYLTMRALTAGDIVFTIPLAASGNVTSVSYSTDGGTTWVDTINEGSDITITVSVSSGDTVMWKGIAQAYALVSAQSSFGSSTTSFDIEGNIMSLLYGDNFINKTTLQRTYTFTSLLKNTNVVSAENLILPATTLKGQCYYYMFQGCSSLTTAPELPATTLQVSCYASMFQGCTSLTTAPVLPATSLANYCYLNMFRNCTNLSEVDCRATNISATGCLSSWLSDVSPTGLFKKEYSTTFPSGVSGIPIGWQVYNYNEPVPELQYKPTSEGGWGNHYINDGDNITFTGTADFAIWTNLGANITYNYTWSFTGNVTLVSIDTTDVGDPRGDNLPLIYKYNITGSAVLTITDNATGTTIITVTFNQ